MNRTVSQYREWIGLSAAVLFACTTYADPAPIVLKAKTLHVGDGRIIDGGMVLIESGRIVRVAPDLAVPQDATLIGAPAGSITPGLIDANAHLDPTGDAIIDTRDARQVVADLFESHKDHDHRPGVDCCGSSCPLSIQHVDGEKCRVCGFPDAAPALAVGTRFSFSGVETSSEVIPHTRVLDSIDLRSPDFERLLRNGVTTVFVSPDPAAVISSQGAIVRTGGPMKDRVVKEADAVMAAMGTDPSWRGWSNRRPWRDNVSFYARRPTTRMGVAWVFRKAFYDTKQFHNGLPVAGADAPCEAAMKVLGPVLAGEIPLRIQARTQPDILTGIRLAQEFDLRFTLIEGTEAYRCLEELKASQTPIVYGPIYETPPGPRAGSAEVDEARLNTLRSLLDAGVRTALTAQELRDEDGLSRQAMYARRYGVPMEEVTRCVTSTPAQILGLGDQIGAIESGKRADLVVWDGEPFDGASRPVVVMIGGEIVLDQRNGKGI